jgi:hypothetical protein
LAAGNPPADHGASREAHIHRDELRHILQIKDLEICNAMPFLFWVKDVDGSRLFGNKSVRCGTDSARPRMVSS